MSRVRAKIKTIPEGWGYLDFSALFGSRILCGMSLKSRDSASLEKLESVLPPQTKIITPLQRHSSNVSLVSRGRSTEVKPSSDAVVTAEPGLCLTVLVADCLPLYLSTAEMSAVGIAHLGWRGMLEGIVENTIESLQINFDCSRGGIKALLGPSIGRCCYEVTPEVAVLFPEGIELRENRFYLDLKGPARDKLITCGLAPNNIFSTENCTSCQRELFFSYRAEGKKSGRMLAFIQMKG